MTRSSVDAIVVGGGIIGCSTAWHLASAGLRVSVIEREGAVGLGSTSRSTAIIRQRYSHPAAMALALEGLRTWERWPELVPADRDGRRAALRPVGVLFLLPAGEASTPKLAEAMRSVGVRVDVLDRGAIASAFPALRVGADEAVEALYEPEGGFVDDPSLATADVARAAAAAGVTFHLGQRLVGVETVWGRDGLEVRGVRTADGTPHEAPVVVNCLGPHSGWLNLVSRSPLPLATAPLRQEVIAGRAPGLASAGLPVVADLLLGFYLRPDPERMRIGAVWSRDETDYVPDPDLADPAVAAERVEARIATARRRVPELAVENARGIVGVYDVTVQDWYPIVDRTDTRGYFVAIGTSGAWFKSGPVIGQLAAAMVTSSLDGRDTDRDPLEVRLPVTGYGFPMALLSRRRTPIALLYGGGVLG